MTATARRELQPHVTMSPSETMADNVSQRRQDIGHAVRQRASEGDIGNTMSPSETMGDDVSQQNDGRISLRVRNTRRINTHLVFDAVGHAGQQRAVRDRCKVTAVDGVSDDAITEALS